MINSCGKMGFQGDNKMSFEAEKKMGWGNGYALLFNYKILFFFTLILRVKKCGRIGIIFQFIAF